MEDTRITFETAILAKEKGYNIEGQTVFDLKNDNKIINFKDNAIQEFINDAETGYRDKALYYLKDGINVTDDNTDEGYFLLAPTQSLLAKWLREKHNIHIELIMDGWGNDDCVNDEFLCYRCFIWQVGKPRPKHTEDLGAGEYEKIFEIGLQEALELI